MGLYLLKQTGIPNEGCQCHGYDGASDKCSEKVEEFEGLSDRTPPKMSTHTADDIVSFLTQRAEHKKLHRQKVIIP